MDDTATTSPKTEPLVLRCIKALGAIDWKSLGFALAVIGGIGGAAWNRVDATIEKALQARTQKGVYELLARRMEDVSLRLAAIEAAHGLPVPIPMSPADGDGIKHGALSRPDEERLASTLRVPAAVLFKAARMPTFEQVQQTIVSDAAAAPEADTPAR
jgi:hypothetical protein